MSAAEAIEMVARCGLAEVWYAVAAVTPWTALAVFAGMGVARWCLRRKGTVPFPAEALEASIARHPSSRSQAARWPDEDTFMGDGLADELAEMLRREGR